MPAAILLYSDLRPRFEIDILRMPMRTAVWTLRSLSSSNILRQAGWLAAAKIVQGVASIAATVVVARHLGPSTFGVLSLACATAVFVGSIANLGLEHIAIRELSTTSPSDRAPMLSTLRRLRCVGALVGVAGLLVISITSAANSYGMSGLLLILCLLPLAQLGDVSEWRLVATGNSRSVAIATALSSPLMAMARLGFALIDSGVSVFAWLLICEWALRSILLALATREHKAIVPDPNVPFWASSMALLRESVPLLLSGIAVFIYMRIDQFMLAAMLGAHEVGLYSAVVALAEVPLVLPALLLRAALPTLTRQSESDPALRDRTLTVLMRSGFYLHLAVAVVAALLAQPLVDLLYGDAFDEAVLALRIQVLAAPFVALGVLSSSWFVLERRTGHALRRTMIGAVLNVVLNLFTIPRYGIAGAAISTLVAQVTATYLADLLHPHTRALFRLKTHAFLPRIGGKS